jgi:hypothetical protein
LAYWIDQFTGVRYGYEADWVRKVRRHLATLLARDLAETATAKHAADICASFWQAYYGLVFPLTFGRDSEEGTFSGVSLFAAGEPVTLDPEQELRQRFLDGQRLPPILAAETKPSELVADHHLITAALCNVILQAQGQGDAPLFHHVRLGVLVHELVEDEHLTARLAKFPEAVQIARFLNDGAGALPNGIDGELLRAIHGEDYSAISTCRGVALIGVGAQRIKQFVFESSGLNEIRGASTLLDDCVARLKTRISNEIGPEVILRAAAATLEFLAPGLDSSDGKPWAEQLRAQFFRETGIAIVAAAGIQTNPSRLLIEYQNVRREFHAALERDRYEIDLPSSESLPFEVRCEVCGRRPAEGWEEDGEKRPICRVCVTKRKLGRNERRGKMRDVLGWLDLPSDPGQLGVASADFVAQDLSDLTPETKRKRLAVIYGDGNNFGDIAGKLDSLASGLQWTHRVERVTQAAVTLALASATKRASPKPPKQLSRLPFQVLSVGGDDMSLFTWARIGLPVCEHFLHLTDLEFRQGDGPRIADKPLAFSLGALICDDKAPVRRTVDFAEKELLKWAKRAAANRLDRRGNLAFHLALTAEQIPAQLKTHLKQVFLCGAAKEVCLTMRPFNADELHFLLEKAAALRERHHEGLLQNLVAAFVQSPYRTALLHYYYQKAREQGNAPDLEAQSFFAQLEGRREAGQAQDWEKLFGGFPLAGVQDQPGDKFFFKWWPAKPTSRSPFGEDPDSDSSVTMLSPLWDLYEVVKILE